MLFYEHKIAILHIFQITEFWLYPMTLNMHVPQKSIIDMFYILDSTK